MIKAIIIDDEKRSRDGLSTLLAKHCRDVEVVGTGHNISTGLQLIYDYSPDLVFLDIAMPDSNGFELFEHLPNPTFETIFITAHEEFAVKAFRMAALDYLTKPIDYRLLMESVARFKEKQQLKGRDKRMKLLLENLNNNPTSFNKIVFPDYQGFNAIRINDILYCQADGSYTHIYLLDGKKITTSKLLKQVVDMLPQETFFRIHKSYVVNINQIQQYLMGDNIHNRN